MFVEAFIARRTRLSARTAHLIATTTTSRGLFRRLVLSNAAHVSTARSTLDCQSLVVADSNDLRSIERHVTATLRTSTLASSVIVAHDRWQR